MGWNVVLGSGDMAVFLNDTEVQNWKIMTGPRNYAWSTFRKP